MTGLRASRAAVAAQLHSQGLNGRQIADRLGVSRSYARELVNDPDGLKVLRRKDSYRGVCLDCGAPTDGSNGLVNAPTRCASCTAKHQKVWTREAVIDAIQRFAAEHGRPPVANEWIYADHVNNYPPRSAVYLASGSCKTNPFGSWAEAIEAAGFPRPTRGHRQRRQA